MFPWHKHTEEGVPLLNLFSGLSSLKRMSKRDQQVLDMRLRKLAHQAQPPRVAADLLRASYELDYSDWSGYGHG
jgi:hypothetical protein